MNVWTEMETSPELLAFGTHHIFFHIRTVRKFCCSPIQYCLLSYNDSSLFAKVFGGLREPEWDYLYVLYNWL